VSLTEYAVRRLLWTVPLLLLVMLATFALLRGAGGDPFNPPPGFSGPPLPLQNELRHFYRLDAPWPVEFAVYVKHVFTFEFGPSLVQRDLSVDSVIEGRFPVTLGLAALAALWSVPAGTALAIYAAGRRGSAADALVTAFASTALITPAFFVAFLLARYGVREWELAPAGWDTWDARVLPAVALGLAPFGYVARLVRTAVVEELDSDFVRAARAKGLRRRRILWVHVLRNALAPVLAASLPMLALLVTGALFVEQAFGIPGASASFVDGARSRDYPLLMGLTVALAVVVLVANAVADIVLAAIDPRVREGLAR
jgi:oligopeptide transport system permease protein